MDTMQYMQDLGWSNIPGTNRWKYDPKNFNADFEGDELNIFIPTNLAIYKELQQITDTNKSKTKLMAKL